MSSPTAPVASRPTTRYAGLSVILIWLITRAVMLLLAITIENVATGDVNYYWRKIDSLGNVGLAQTLNEYPTPVVWLLAIPYALGIGSQTGYLIAFIGLMMLLDAAFTFVLYRSAGNRRDPAVLFWLFFVFLIGPLSYLRFDLVPAVLAGLSLLVARRQPWLTGALTGLGAAIKLWPALLIAPFASYRRGRRATLIGFVVAGFGLALISLITGGPKRLFSPLTWQSDRGLQIESIWA
ncbi:MAG TPA: glycosyltransferase family 87 protein, partial [Microlunatus sp.]